MRILLEMVGAGALFCVVLAIAVTALLLHPNTPLPANWNPTRPLDPLANWTRVSDWQLRRAERSAQGCLAALDNLKISYQALPPLREKELCHIANQIRLSRVGQIDLRPVETSCRTALRFGLWVHHDLRPLAEQILNSPLTRIDHFGSYSCRTIAGSSRMSEHATANAIDISGYQTADGQRLSLKTHWSDRRASRFLRQSHSTACRWFHVTLGPDYNAAHADHFHLDLGRWRACR